MTKRRWYDSHPDKPGYKEKDQLRSRQPGDKLYSCFPTNFVRFQFGDNDFWWALKHSIPLLLERLTWDNADFSGKVDFVADAASLAFQAMCLISEIRGEDPLPKGRYDYSTWRVKVEYLDHIDRSNDNGDTVYLDCWSGEFY